jgi:hypothetical protein
MCNPSYFLYSLVVSLQTPEQPHERNPFHTVLSLSLAKRHDDGFLSGPESDMLLAPWIKPLPPELKIGYEPE